MFRSDLYGSGTMYQIIGDAEGGKQGLFTGNTASFPYLAKLSQAIYTMFRFPIRPVS